MNTKANYEKKVQAQLDDATAKIEQLKAKANEVEANAQVEYHEKLDELLAQQAVIQEKLDELKEANEHTWHEMKVTIDLIWDAFEETIMSIVS